MITVHYNSEIHEFETLDQAMAWAKELGECVRIKFGGMEVVGKFGADGVLNGKLPNGESYIWRKRRRSKVTKKH